MALILTLALAAQAATAGAAAPSIQGMWRSPGGNSIISIAPCGTDLCGTVAWASEQAKKDASRTTPSLVGTQLLTGLEQDRSGRWHGRLFIPDRNMRVTAKIAPVSDQQLKVSGCAAGRALCKSTLWTRVAELPAPAN
jgi:uncharacterized protein (DUF2147 family)